MEAFANLVDNAIKFTPEGGRIQLFLSNTVHGPVAKVCDTGPGIPSSHRANVFTRFYRCNQSRHVAGNGLGLSLVSAITNLHGFSIEIKDGSPGCIFELLCFSNERQYLSEGKLSGMNQPHGAGQGVRRQRENATTLHNGGCFGGRRSRLTNYRHGVQE